MQEKIQKELEALNASGTETLSRIRFTVAGVHPMNPSQVKLAQTEYAKFKTRSLNLIRRSFGIDDDHYKQLQKLGETAEPEFANFPSCLGIVEAALYASQAGLLYDVKSLIAAELLGDFIDQADSLLAANYHVPAASLAGAILEDSLRKLWAKREWPVPAKTNINSLNTKLANADEYTLLTQKRITAYADIRNNADHGNYKEFEPSDVEDMVKWVRRFAEEHLK